MNQIFTIVVWIGASLFLNPIIAQPSKKLLAHYLDKSLSTYLINQLPHHFCDNNKGRHTYMGQLKIERTNPTAKVIGPNQFEPRLMIYGSSRADFYSNFDNGSSKIHWIAQVKEVADSIEVVKLKWRKNECMRFKTLIDLEEGEAEWWEESFEDPLSANDQQDEVGFYEDDPSLDAPENTIPDEQEAIAKNFKTDLDIYANLAPKGHSKVQRSDNITHHIDGKLVNTSSQKSYKNISLKISYFTSENEFLQDETWVIYELFEPKKEFLFWYPLIYPAGAASYKVEIDGAIEVIE